MKTPDVTASQEEPTELLASGEKLRPEEAEGWLVGWWMELLLLLAAGGGGGRSTGHIHMSAPPPQPPPTNMARAHFRLIEAFSSLQLAHKRRVFIYGQLWRRVF